MTDYFDGPLVGLDIESTGIDQFEDRIVTFSLIYSASADSEPQILEWLIDPLVQIAEGATAVHGISTKHARAHGLYPQIALQDISNKLEPIVAQGIPICIYNAPFDTTMLWEEFKRHRIQTPYTIDQTFSKVIDPLVIDKQVDKFRKGSRKLIDTAALYGYNNFEAHNSSADVLATIFITRKLKSWFQPGMTIELLQEFQKEAKAEQAAGLQEHFRKEKQDETIVISGDWPYQLTPEQNV